MQERLLRLVIAHLVNHAAPDAVKDIDLVAAALVGDDPSPQWGATQGRGAGLRRRLVPRRLAWEPHLALARGRQVAFGNVKRTEGEDAPVTVAPAFASLFPILVSFIPVFVPLLPLFVPVRPRARVVPRGAAGGEQGQHEGSQESVFHLSHMENVWCKPRQLLY
ncbi:hypothetical protein PKOR_16235 [Pontibacter korlensis]|uniref:Uncharacterized protein n=1 Tax=Pontibacter korlensis TaxID=400092 RepID=A0A0E3UXK8_9BACT|nr:hypothetical protein PKOR_16235 [Pontibacter korlensis]